MKGLRRSLKSVSQSSRDVSRSDFLSSCDFVRFCSCSFVDPFFVQRKDGSTKLHKKPNSFFEITQNKKAQLDAFLLVR